MDSKILRTNQKIEDHWPYVLKRACPAGLVTLSLGLGANRYIQRNYPKVFERSTSARSFMIVASFFAGFLTTYEIFSLKHERATMRMINGLDDYDVETKEIELPKTITDRALEYISENRFKVFLGAWLSSLVGAGYVVSRDKYMTTSQKVVQARMYAQGFTLLLIVGSAGLTVFDNKDNTASTHAHAYKDETWKKLIENHEK
ncbi:hypothetical protein V1511DRAFT_491356 [Dipodascopsis uninucleata]